MVALLSCRLFSALLMSCGALLCCVVVEVALLFPKVLTRGLSQDQSVVRCLSLFNDGRSALALIKTYSRVVPYETFRITVRRYDLQAGGPCVELPERAGAAWRQLTTTRDGRALLCAEDGSLYRLDLTDAAASLVALEKAEGGCIDFLVCSDDGALAISAGRWLSAWNVASGKVIWECRERPITSCAFVPGTHRLVCAFATGDVEELDSATGQSVRMVSSHGPANLHLAISADGRLLAVVNADGRCTMVDLASALPLWSRALGYFSSSPRFSHDGAWLIVPNAGREFKTLVISAATGKDERTIDSSQGVAVGAQITRDGMIYVWDGTGTISTWDLATGKMKRRFAP